MIRTTVTDLVNEALRIAGMTGSNALSWLNKITLLNNAYQKIYYKIARGADRPYVRSFVSNSNTFKVPRDLQKIYAIRPYINEEQWSGQKIQPIEETGEDVYNKYIIRNNMIKINSDGGPWLIEYIPTPDTLLFVAKLRPLDHIPLNAAIIRMDDEVIIYSTTNSDNEAVYYIYNIEKATTEQVLNLFEPYINYLDWTGIHIEDNKLLANEEELTDYFVDSTKQLKSFAIAGPYLYINYTDGTVDGYEGMKYFKYDPFLSTSNTHNIEVLAGWTNDQTGYGLVVRETKLSGAKLWLAGFTEESVIDYPINIHWDFLTTYLAVQMQQANGEINEALMQKLQNAEMAFELTLARDQTPSSVRRTKSYR